MLKESPDGKSSSAAATWGVIFGLLTGSGCGPFYGGTIDHSQRPICGESGTTDPCANAAGTCTTFSALDLPDGGQCVLPDADGGTTGATGDGGATPVQMRCGFCNG
jgi:hypothetical protein